MKIKEITLKEGFFQKKSSFLMQLILFIVKKIL